MSDKPKEQAINAIFFSQDEETGERFYLFQVPSDHERAKVNSDGIYRLVGGISNDGESLQQTLIREALEEILGEKKAQDLLEPGSQAPLSTSQLHAAIIIYLSVPGVFRGEYPGLPPTHQGYFNPGVHTPDDWFSTINYVVSVPVKKEDLELLRTVSEETARRQNGNEETKDALILSESELLAMLKDEKTMVYRNEREALLAHLRHFNAPGIENVPEAAPR